MTVDVRTITKQNIARVFNNLAANASKVNQKVKQADVLPFIVEKPTIRHTARFDRLFDTCLRRGLIDPKMVAE